MRRIPLSKFPFIHKSVLELHGLVGDYDTCRFIFEYLTACWPGPNWTVYPTEFFEHIIVHAEISDTPECAAFLLKYLNSKQG